MNVKSNDQFDWLIGTGGTTSRFTGPSVDHTVGTSSGMLARYFTSPEVLLQHPLSDTRQYSICGYFAGAIANCKAQYYARVTREV